jgi:hypothetical protein
MRYKPKSSAALHIALGGLPAQMRVEVDSSIEVTAKTVGELRKVNGLAGNFSCNRAASAPRRQRRHGEQGEHRDARSAKAVGHGSTTPPRASAIRPTIRPGLKLLADEGDTTVQALYSRGQAKRPAEFSIAIGSPAAGAR